jgi:hypothetical protein
MEIIAQFLALLSRALNGANVLLLQVQTQITLPTVGDTFVDKAIAVLNRYLNFAVGPIGTVVTACAILIGVGLWFFSPKEGIVGVVLRIVAAGCVLLNVPILVQAMRM